jgi:hypothetical protein
MTTRIRWVVVIGGHGQERDPGGVAGHELELGEGAELALVDAGLALEREGLEVALLRQGGTCTALCPRGGR